MKICETLDNYIHQLGIYLRIFNILGLSTKTIEQKLNYIYFLKGLYKCEEELSLIYEVFKKYKNKKSYKEKNKTKEKKDKRKVIDNIRNFINNIDINNIESQIINIDLEQINNIFILKFILQNFKLDNDTKQKIKARIAKIKKQLKEEQRINRGSNEQNLSQMGNSIN